MKIVLFITALFFSYTSIAAFKFNIDDPKNIKASEIKIPIGETGNFISVLDLSRISVEDFQNLTGKKMNFIDKILFKISQRKISKSISADGNISNKKLLKALKTDKDGKHFHLGTWGIIGIIVLAGTLIAMGISIAFNNKH